NLVKQGAGLLNAEGATRLAGAIRTDVATAIVKKTIKTGDSLLRTGVSFPSASSTLAGESVPWGGYIFAGGSHVLGGTALFKKYQPIYDPALVWVQSGATLGEQPVTAAPLISS